MSSDGDLTYGIHNPKPGDVLEYRSLYGQKHVVVVCRTLQASEGGQGQVFFIDAVCDNESSRNVMESSVTLMRWRELFGANAASRSTKVRVRP